MIKYVKSRTMAFTLISFLISLVLAGIIIAAAGYSPVEAYSAMLGGAFGSTYNLAQTAGTAIPLIFAGLAMAVASRAGIFNIGIEGQILAAALPAALAGSLYQGTARRFAHTCMYSGGCHLRRHMGHAGGCY